MGHLGHACAILVKGFIILHERLKVLLVLAHEGHHFHAQIQMAAAITLITQSS